MRQKEGMSEGEMGDRKNSAKTVDLGGRRERVHTKRHTNNRKTETNYLL